MNRWKNIDRTSAGRPTLLDNEAILFVQNSVGLYDGKFKSPNHQDGTLYLTSHRVCYVDELKPMLHSIGVDLEQIDKIETSPGFLKSSPKITLHFKMIDTSTADSTNPTTPPQANWICTYCTFSNPYPSNYTSTSPTPPCLNCGMPPPPGTLTTPPPSNPPPSYAPSSNPTPLLHITPSPPSTEALFPCPRCTFLNHPALTACEICGEPLISPNLPPILANAESIDRGISPAPQLGSDRDRRNYVRLSFRAGGEKVFLERLKAGISHRAWEYGRSGDAGAGAGGGAGGMGSGIGEVEGVMVDSGKMIGINGLERASVAQRLRDDVVLQASLKDLEALMARAKDLVSLAEQIAMKVSSASERSALRESTEMLGLNTPIVTKELVGGQEAYYIELARQVAEFLTERKDGKESILRREGGIIPLIDVFAIYNRARGVALVSPSDLAKACAMFPKLRLPVRLKTFKSGLIVVQDSSTSEEIMERNLLRYIASLHQGATPLDIGAQFHWSVGVAMEVLQMAEEKGVLCRDVTIEGVRFWENRFLNELINI